MAKKKTLRKLVDEVSVLLQKLVRLKAADNQGYCKCVTCGVKKHWKEMDGGHFISRTHQGTKILEENIHPQCKGCNLRSGKGDTLVTLNYRNFMLDMYGESFIEELERMARTPANHFRPDLEVQKVELRNQIRELEEKTL